MMQSLTHDLGAQSLILSVQDSGFPPKKILQVQLEVLKNGQISNIPWFLESCVFSSHIPTLDPLDIVDTFPEPSWQYLRLLPTRQRLSERIGAAFS